MEDSYDSYEKKTIETYDKVGEKWAIAHELVVTWEEEFKYFHKKYLTAGRLIDIGCGSGRDIEVFVKLGLDCVGIDASKNLIEIAKEKVPKAEFKLLNMYELSKLDETFDGFLAIASLLHIPRQKIDLAMEQIKSVLKPSAFGMITLKDGIGELFEVRDVEGRHEERFFTFWSKEEFEEVLDRNNFELLEYGSRNIHRNKWHCFFVKLK